MLADPCGSKMGMSRRFRGTVQEYPILLIGLICSTARGFLVESLRF